MLQGFKDFIMKGNVVDLAVAVVMGGAFGAVVTALVDKIIMPLISMLVGSPNFDQFLVFGQVQIGAFLTALVNFLLIALAIYFVIVLPMNKAIERRNARLGITEDDAADPNTVLLTEIRDALKGRAN